MVDGDNRAHLRLLSTGRAYGDRVEVLSGINEGDRIIVEGTEKVKDGKQNRIKNRC